MMVGKNELSGEVSLRADLILVVAGRLWSEACATGRLRDKMYDEALRWCAEDAMALAAAVDRAVAKLRSAKKGEVE